MVFHCYANLGRLRRLENIAIVTDLVKNISGQSVLSLNAGFTLNFNNFCYIIVRCPLVYSIKQTPSLITPLLCLHCFRIDTLISDICIIVRLCIAIASYSPWSSRPPTSGIPVVNLNNVPHLTSPDLQAITSFSDSQRLAIKVSAIVAQSWRALKILQCPREKMNRIHHLLKFHCPPWEAWMIQSQEFGHPQRAQAEREARRSDS